MMKVQSMHGHIVVYPRSLTISRLWSRELLTEVVTIHVATGSSAAMCIHLHRDMIARRCFIEL